MMDLAKPITGFALAVVIAGAAGSAAAASHGKNALYPPVPTVNKNTAIPQKSPLANRPALKTGLVSRPAGGGAGMEDAGPTLGVERSSPERQIPNSPVLATIGPARAPKVPQPE